VSVALISAVDPYPTDAGKKVVLAGFIEYFASRYGADNVHYIRIGGAPSPDFPVVLHTVPGPSRSDLLRALTTRVSTGRASLQEAFLRSPATAGAIADVLADTAPRLQIYDTVRTAQYAADDVAAQQICYLDDLFSDRYDRMLAAARRYRGIDINPLGNFAAHIPAALRPLADNRLGQTALLRLERTLVRRSEDRTARRFRRCLLVNAGEAAELSRRTGVPAERIMSVPPLVATPPAPVRRYDGEPEFVFLGLLSLPHNDDGLRWFLTSVWPAVLERRPDARLRVIGREARPGVLALADTLASSVSVEGYVADLSAALEGAAGLVNPLRFGSGVKLKVIDALGRHLPVVSTEVGAEGIASGPGTGVLIADEPTGFAELLCGLTDPVRNAELSDEAAGHFRRSYSRSAVFDRYDLAFCPD
jgi:hypothetical protein